MEDLLQNGDPLGVRQLLVVKERGIQRDSLGVRGLVNLFDQRFGPFRRWCVPPTGNLLRHAPQETVLVYNLFPSRGGSDSPPCQQREPGARRRELAVDFLWRETGQVRTLSKADTRRPAAMGGG